MQQRAKAVAFNFTTEPIHPLQPGCGDVTGTVRRSLRSNGDPSCRSAQGNSPPRGVNYLRVVDKRNRLRSPPSFCTYKDASLSSALGLHTIFSMYPGLFNSSYVPGPIETNMMQDPISAFGPWLTSAMLSLPLEVRSDLVSHCKIS